jgi:His-Xaa-Ser system radical SAM maturase HxsB
MAATSFLGPSAYGYGSTTQYHLLPFRFDRWSNGQVFLASDVGEFLFLPPDTFQAFIDHRLCPEDPQYFDLKACHFLADDQSSGHLDVLASKYRTKKSFLDGFTKLHIFVTSLRCNQSCPYCQVSRQGAQADPNVYDMSPEVLEHSVRLMLTSPAPRVTMEFQGGEAFINFDLLQEGVRLAKKLNVGVGKQIDFVVCTNLTLLEDCHLDWCKSNDVLISTSLDGPAEVHDHNRPMGKGKPSHAVVTRNILRAQDALGKQAVSALMTTTLASLSNGRAIVDEYLRLGLGSIFIRELNPFGFASKSAVAMAYRTDEFVRFYTDILDYIIAINRTGRTFSEAYASLILTKILTPWPVGFVDLQSPSGAGLGVCVYNYDGDVYASDESRMLAEGGDHAFRLGNVLKDDYESIFFGETMQTIAAAACNESLAGCSECVYQSYCGADPVRRYRTQGDIFGNRAADAFCQKNSSIIKHLLGLLHKADDDPDLDRILWAWVRREDINHLRLPT